MEKAAELSFYHLKVVAKIEQPKLLQVNIEQLEQLLQLELLCSPSTAAGFSWPDCGLKQ